ncbi:MAG: phospholipase A [Xanthomonadales bacterium]|nr:phospholipase A [Xanthomonadales bacterium]
MNLSIRTKTLLLALSLGATSNAQAHIEAILSSPNQALMARQESLWTVLFTNSGDHVEAFVAPAQLNAYWQQGEERHVLSFQRHSAENPSQLKPQAVMPVMYSVTLPQGLDAGIASVYLQEMPDRAVTVVLAQDDSALIAAVDDQGQIITDHAITDDEADDTPFVQVAATNESIDEDVGRNNFIDNFYAYEPLYFLFGTDPNNAKFQISFKYRFVDDDSEFAQEHPWLSSFYVAYTQTSFWDLESESTYYYYH